MIRSSCECVSSTMSFKLAFNQRPDRNFILFNFELAEDIGRMQRFFLLSNIYSKFFLYCISSFPSSNKYHLSVLEIYKSQVLGKRDKVLVLVKLLQNLVRIALWFFSTWISLRDRDLWIDNGNNVACFFFYAEFPLSFTWLLWHFQDICKLCMVLMFYYRIFSLANGPSSISLPKFVC